MEKLGRNLKAERKNFKLTQSQVAEMLKIDRVTYLGYEKGNHDPSLEMLIRLADFFKTSTDYLLGRYNN